jgi:hypothetical protein
LVGIVLAGGGVDIVFQWSGKGMVDPVKVAGWIGILAASVRGVSIKCAVVLMAGDADQTGGIQTNGR